MFGMAVIEMQLAIQQREKRVCLTVLGLSTS